MDYKISSQKYTIFPISTHAILFKIYTILYKKNHSGIRRDEKEYFKFVPNHQQSRITNHQNRNYT